MLVLIIYIKKQNLSKKQFLETWEIQIRKEKITGKQAFKKVKKKV